MNSFRKIVVATGVAGGVVFAIHATFPGVNSWPMIWPAIAGATAFWLATRQAGPHRLRTGLAAAFATGVITGAITFIATSIALTWVVHTVAAPKIQQSGVSTGFVTSAGILGLAVLGAIDVVVAFIGGALMLPVRYFQARHVTA
jgi:uncharacterized membrane protein